MPSKWEAKFVMCYCIEVRSKLEFVISYITLFGDEGKGRSMKLILDTHLYPGLFVSIHII